MTLVHLHPLLSELRFLSISSSVQEQLVPAWIGSLVQLQCLSGIAVTVVPVAGVGAAAVRVTGVRVAAASVAGVGVAAVPVAGAGGAAVAVILLSDPETSVSP